MRFRNIIEQIDTMNELNKVSYFVNSLKMFTQREMAYQALETFEDAWKLAIGLGKPKEDQQGYRPFQGERNQSSNRKYHNHSTPMELNYAGSPSSSSSSFSSSSYQRNNKDNYKGQQIQGNCHNCGKTGHWKRECPQTNN